MRRMLSGVRIWAATVLINSMIMTLYLWHLTVMVIIVALAFLAGGLGLGLDPGSAEWWATRPIWIGVLYAVLLPVTLLLSTFERRPRAADAATPVAARLVGGAMLLCLGVALLALFGLGTTPIPHLDIAALVMVVVGAGISGLLPGFK
jgi:phosphoglycerol transferase MdoB-like AlkP superfamily enzyme